MDFIKQKTTSSTVRSVWVKALSFVLISALLLGYISSRRVSIEKEGILIATVKHGDLTVTVDGYGKLTSNKTKLITAHSQVTVQEIVLKPGSHVNKDTVIVKISQP